MKPVCVLLALALPLFAAATSHAGAKKQSAVSVRFYAEGGAEGGEFSHKIELINPKRETYMSEIAVVSERDIKAYFPFAAKDGSGTFGAYFQLDDHGKNLLAQYTGSRRYMLAFFNGRHVVDLYIDKAVNDGIAVIPNGLTSTDIELLDLVYPVIGKGDKPAGKPKPKAPKADKAKAKAAPTATPMPRMAPALQRQPDGTLAPAPH